jgi:hypothetical protein
VDLIEEGRSIEDRLGPGLELGEVDVIGLDIIFQEPGVVHGVIKAGEA